MNFFVTIPNYCEKQHQLWMLNKCLESLFDVEPSLSGKVFVVDDVSPLDIMPVISKYPVKLLRKRVKSSYSAMINASVKFSKQLGADCLITVNNDIEHQTRFMDELSNIFNSDKDIDVVGALLFYPDGRTQHSGVEIMDANGPWAHDAYRGTNLFSQPRFCAHVTGAWKAIRIYEHQLKYNENFPFAYEDIDFCLRAWERFKKVYFTNKIFHLHHESATRSTRVTEREMIGSALFRSMDYEIPEINRMINLANYQARSS